LTGNMGDKQIKLHGMLQFNKLIPDTLELYAEDVSDVYMDIRTSTAATWI